MDIQTIQGNLLYQQLTPKQQKFVTEYLTNGCDQKKAAQVAYNCKNEQSATTVGYSAIKVPKIAALIKIYFGYNPSQEQFTKDDFLSLIAEKLRDKTLPAGTFVSLCNLYAILNGWKSDKPETETKAAEEKREKTQDELVTELVLKMEKENVR